MISTLICVAYRRPSDWTVTWGGSGTIYGWGHNHRGQLGGVEGGKVKFPQPCEALSAIKPVQIVGGEQTLFAVTTEGKVCVNSFGVRMGITAKLKYCRHENFFNGEIAV